ncbi:MAG: hypothetical protein O9296_01880 [Novosphingobium sp.]|nr:hypothetical protein [Novosphingobium sp.]
MPDFLTLPKAQALAGRAFGLLGTLYRAAVVTLAFGMVAHIIAGPVGILVAALAAVLASRAFPPSPERDLQRHRSLCGGMGGWRSELHGRSKGAAVTRRPHPEPLDAETAILAALDKIDALSVQTLTKAAEGAVRALGAAARSGEVPEVVARRTARGVLADMGFTLSPASADALITKWLALPTSR